MPKIFLRAIPDVVGKKVGAALKLFSVDVFPHWHLGDYKPIGNIDQYLEFRVIGQLVIPRPLIPKSYDADVYLTIAAMNQLESKGPRPKKTKRAKVDARRRKSLP